MKSGCNAATFFLQTRVSIFLILIIRFFTTSQRKKRIDVQLDELWTVDCGLSTIMRSTSTRLQALVRLRIIRISLFHADQ
jgi:hypothetical protein